MFPGIQLISITVIFKSSLSGIRGSYTTFHPQLCDVIVGIDETDVIQIQLVKIGSGQLTRLIKIASHGIKEASGRNVIHKYLVFDGCDDRV